MDNYIPGNYKWKENRLGNSVVDFKAKALKWEN